jgi:hypothetical protein
VNRERTHASIQLLFHKPNIGIPPLSKNLTFINCSAFGLSSGSMSRARRPHFGFHDQQKLLETLGNARDWVTKCGSGCTDFGSARYQKCRGVQKAIDELAEDLTGDRAYFHLKAHSTPGGPRFT